MSTKFWSLFIGLSLAVATTHAQKAAPAGEPVALIRGPYLQVATPQAITVRWRTDVKTRSRVKYGTAIDQLDRFVDDSVLTNEHIVRITGLQPRTKYYYSIGSLNVLLQADTSNYFYTLPNVGETAFYRIGVVGDCGNNSVNQHQVRDQLLKYLGPNYMDAWILLGDNAYTTGSDAEFQSKFFNVYKDDLLKKYPMFPAPGNHDYNDHDFPGAVENAVRTHQVAYYANFSMPTNGEAGGVPSHTQAFYSFDIGNMHFLSLDSYGKEEDQYHLYDTLGPQVQWIKHDLEANKNKQWVIAYWHHPPYTMGSHSSDKEEDLVAIRENFIRILERYGVDLILCGHSHDYERTRLIHGHYGMAASFSAAQHNVSNSSGLYDGSDNSCPYIKDSTNVGTVYVVSGSAGQLGGKQKDFPHKAMYYSNADQGGASLLEVQGNRLDLKWICADGEVRDHFTMMKEVNRNTVIHAARKSSVTLTASFTGSYVWNKGKETTKSITVKPGAGTTVYTVQDKESCVKDTFTVITK